MPHRASGVFASGERGNKMTEDKDKVLKHLTRCYWRFVKWRLERHIKEPYNRDVSLKLDSALKRLEE